MYTPYICYKNVFDQLKTLLFFHKEVHQTLFQDNVRSGALELLHIKIPRFIRKKEEKVLVM